LQAGSKSDSRTPAPPPFRFVEILGNQKREAFMTNMNQCTPGELLLAVEKPSRYTGGELNAVRKGFNDCRLHFALAFPDAYEVGMSHLGLQILYTILNGMPEVVCERCYAPFPDMERELRRRSLPLRSLESQQPLVNFDIIGFSFQYELSYTNVLLMLELGGIPLHREERNEDHPLIIAGGPSAFNPGPMAPFIDAFVIGEGEEAIAEIAASVLAVRSRGGKRPEQIESLAEIKGVYVPGIHLHGERIIKRTVADLDAWRVPLCPIVPLMKTIHDRVTLEIARGCTRGCRFCQAGMVWRPVRERTPLVLEELAEAMLQATGHDEISLLSLSSGDYTLIEPLLKTLIDRYYSGRVALALPSLRVETLTPKLIEAIRSVRKTSFTLAPEAGTQRLRDIINKGNTEDELITTTTRVFEAGWKAVKLYFMLGLPGEQTEDLEGIVDLAQKTLRTAKNRGQVTISLSTFVPKPHTPFQWQRQIGIEETTSRQDFFRRHLKSRNITVKWHDARMSLLEGILSRGGEETGALIEKAFRLGCRFDGWSDRFRFDLWDEAMKQTGIDPEVYLRERPFAEMLPWNSIESGVSSEFLIDEAKKAEAGKPTPDCRKEACNSCGVCDHRTIRMMTAPVDSPVGTFFSAYTAREMDGRVEKSLRIRFIKTGQARFLSHLELSSSLTRAMSIGGFHFVYSSGYHPHPKISFAGATSVGMESQGEFMDIRIFDPLGPLDPLIVRINAALPEGVVITAISELAPQAHSLAALVTGFSYDLILPEETDDAELTRIETAIGTFLETESFKIMREAGGKSTVKEIRPFVASLAMDHAGHRIHLSVPFGPNGTVRPAEILTHVLTLPAETLHRTSIIKTATLLSDFAGLADRNIFLQEY
jgi:radical SAM family uncharacterized protein/radical SAM-linked protein